MRRHTGAAATAGVFAISGVCSTDRQSHAGRIRGSWELWEQREPFHFPTVVERDTVDPGVT
jgi:hypothetical protein